MPRCNGCNGRIAKGGPFADGAIRGPAQAIAQGFCAQFGLVQIRMVFALMIGQRLGGMFDRLVHHGQCKIGNTDIAGIAFALGGNKISHRVFDRGGGMRPMD